MLHHPCRSRSCCLLPTACSLHPVCPDSHAEQMTSAAYAAFYCPRLGRLCGGQPPVPVPVLVPTGSSWPTDLSSPFQKDSIIIKRPISLTPSPAPPDGWLSPPRGALPVHVRGCRGPAPRLLSSLARQTRSRFSVLSLTTWVVGCQSMHAE